MRKNIAIFALFMGLFFPISAMALTAIFYQPQAADTKISTQAWPTLFHSVRQQGFDALIIQWSEYGDFLKGNGDRDWLVQRVIEANNAGLKLIIGLKSDPDVFSKLHESPSTLRNYFNKLTQENKSLINYWVSALPNDAILGWYLPLEIDDKEWRDQDKLEVLQSYLQRESSINAGKPTYISSFFTGNMTPQNYANMIINLKRNSTIKLWIQDGGGTNRLTKSERTLYLNQLSNCKDPIADGVIYEIFHQTQQDEKFLAQNLSTANLASKLKMRAPCQGDSIFFEMRYLITLPPAAPPHEIP